MENYVSAAARHWDNAEFLANDERWQEAAYLAGYVAECSLKALLEHTASDIPPKPLGHNLTALTGDALELAVLLSPASRRYPAVPGASRWSPEHRYEETGFLSIPELKRMVAESHEIGRSVLIELVLDGIVEEIPQ